MLLLDPRRCHLSSESIIEHLLTLKWSGIPVLSYSNDVANCNDSRLRLTFVAITAATINDDEGQWHSCVNKTVCDLISSVLIYIYTYITKSHLRSLHLNCHRSQVRKRRRIDLHSPRANTHTAPMTTFVKASIKARHPNIFGFCAFIDDLLPELTMSLCRHDTSTRTRDVTDKTKMYVACHR